MNKKNNKLLYKYKINNIDNLFYNEMLKKKIKNLILSDDNIIFIGNSGSGKTSLINILKKNIKIIYNYQILIAKVMIISCQALIII